jgi:hypothetical protein
MLYPRYLRAARRVRRAFRRVLRFLGFVGIAGPIGRFFVGVVVSRWLESRTSGAMIGAKERRWRELEAPDDGGVGLTRIARTNYIWQAWGPNCLLKSRCLLLSGTRLACLDSCGWSLLASRPLGALKWPLLELVISICSVKATGVFGGLSSLVGPWVTRSFCEDDADTYKAEANSN